MARKLPRRMCPSQSPSGTATAQAMAIAAKRELEVVAGELEELRAATSVPSRVVSPWKM